MVAARQREFAQSAGTSALPGLTCQTCGYSSENRKHFKREGDGHTCSTGHYQDDKGNTKRARNPFAR